MNQSIFNILLSGCCIGLIQISSVCAGPKLSIDTVEAFFGTVREGSKAFLSHTFSFKNIGDDTLKIIKIRPSCSCESYMADSIIAPGKGGQITCKLDLKDVAGGNFQKRLTVNTNDGTYPKFFLYLSGKFITIFEFDPKSIVLPTMKKKEDFETLTLETAKTDLLVKEVFFQPDGQMLDWKQKLPIKFAFNKSPRTSAKGPSRYTLKVWYFPVYKEAVYGKFAVITNHPEKPQLDIPGVLDPVK